MRIHKVLSLAATAAIVAGCSGGSSSPVAPLARATPAALPAGVAKNATRLTFTIPNHSNSKRYAIGSRKPKYVSPSTAGVFATVTSTTMASPTPQYQGYSLAPNTTATTANPVTCGAQSDAGYTCTLYGNLAPDSYTITLVATDAAESGNTGTKPVGNALSVDTETPTIAANTSNVVDFTLQGIVRGFYATRQFDGVPNSAAAPTATPSNVPQDRQRNATVSPPTMPPTIPPIMMPLPPPSPPTATPTATPTDTPSPSPTPTANPTSFPVTFLPLDFDGNPITGAANLAYVNNAGAYVMNAQFNVTVSDAHCFESPCFAIAGNSAMTTGLTTTFTVDYNGLSDPGTPPGAAATTGPGFGQVQVNAPGDYVGFTGSPSGAAATEYIEPLFPMVDQTSAFATGEATATFVTPGQSITAYAIQANKVSGSSGYTVDDSDCSANGTAGDIANALNLQPNLEPNVNGSDVFGTSLTITAGNPTLPQGSSSTSVSCVIRVYDDNFTTPASGIADEADLFVNFAANGSTITVTPGKPSAPNARMRGAD